MSVISIRFDDRDHELVKQYAALKHTTISELLRNAILTEIEEEIDISIFDQAFKSMNRTYTLQEVKEEIGL